MLGPIAVVDVLGEHPRVRDPPTPTHRVPTAWGSPLSPPYPVHDEDPAHAEPLLQQLG